MTALQLRTFACLCMLLDHIGILLHSNVLRGIGRMAFPLFVFLICNGYIHTSNRGRYALRLAGFALLSQIPFCLFLGYGLWEKGNVFFTLLLALLSLWSMDTMLRRKSLRFFAWLPPAVLVLLFYVGWLRTDYGAKGILLAVVFHFIDFAALRGKLLTAVGMFLSMNYSYVPALGLSLYRGVSKNVWVWPTVSRWDIVSLCSLFSLGLIFSYRGEKGRAFPHPKLAQYSFYLFYPVHLLLLWAVGKWLA